MTRWAGPVRDGWVVRGEVPGPNVDEFADVDEVIAALAEPGAEHTLLAVQHAHRTPEALAHNLSLVAALPAARRALDRLRATAYEPASEVVAPYAVAGRDGVAAGVLCLVDPAAVDARGRARVRHSEEVYPQVVADRAQVLAGLGAATSAAMLVPVTEYADLTTAVLDTVESLGTPAVHSTDSAGRDHQLWLVRPGADQDNLLDIVQRHPLLVADGNHRVAAATRAGSALLALVTAGPALRIGAIHRGLVGVRRDPAELAAAWRRVGLTVTETTDPNPPEHPGTVIARIAGTSLRIDLPPAEEPLPRIDHGLVERLLIADALGIDPAGPRVHTLPAGRPVGPHIDVVLELAPVPFADVLAVHEQQRRMPRKSTYFTPKPRSGLLLADLN